MKPVIFEYAIKQRSDDFNAITYSHEDDVSSLNGKNLVGQCKASLMHLTKTNTNRESDDCSEDLLLSAFTKTDTIRETDDTTTSELLNIRTLTEVKREADDYSIDFSDYAINDSNSVGLLLTKTYVGRESDE